MNLNYQKITVFNFRITYYLIRIFTFFWIWEQFQLFHVFSQRPKGLYNPDTLIEKILFPQFPSAIYFGLLCILSILALIYSLIKPHFLINIIIFITLALISLPIVGYGGLSHTNHLLILFYFLSIFLLPKKLKDSDFKYVQYVYFGLLATYSAAGFWKLLIITKNVFSQDGGVSWITPNAAKYNSIYNYYIIDEKIPSWMEVIYSHTDLWTVITLIGIIAQSLSFLGAFNRKYLTFTLLFLIVFHYYTKYFVIADLKIMKIGLIFLFFPYHWLYPLTNSKHTRN